MRSLGPGVRCSVSCLALASYLSPLTINILGIGATYFSNPPPLLLCRAGLLALGAVAVTNFGAAAASPAVALPSPLLLRAVNWLVVADVEVVECVNDVALAVFEIREVLYLPPAFLRPPFCFPGDGGDGEVSASATSLNRFGRFRVRSGFLA